MLLVEVSVSWFTHLVYQERRKYAKYAVNSDLPEDTPLNVEGTFPNGDNLATELGRDLGLVVRVVPIVIGATGEVSNNLRRFLGALDLFTSSESDNLIERMARNATIGSARIIKAHCSIHTQLGANAVPFG